MEPLALKHAASALHTAQCLTQRGSVYTPTHMVVFHVFDSESEQLSGEAHSVCLQRILKDMQVVGARLHANELKTVR